MEAAEAHALRLRLETAEARLSHEAEQVAVLEDRLREQQAEHSVALQAAEERLKCVQAALTVQETACSEARQMAEERLLSWEAAVLTQREDARALQAARDQIRSLETGLQDYQAALTALQLAQENTCILEANVRNLDVERSALRVSCQEQAAELKAAMDRITKAEQEQVGVSKRLEEVQAAYARSLEEVAGLQASVTQGAALVAHLETSLGLERSLKVDVEKGISEVREACEARAAQVHQLEEALAEARSWGRHVDDQRQLLEIQLQVRALVTLLPLSSSSSAETCMHLQHPRRACLFAIA